MINQTVRLKVHIFNLRKQVDAEQDNKLLHTIAGGKGFAD